MDIVLFIKIKILNFNILNNILVIYFTFNNYTQRVKNRKRMKNLIVIIFFLLAGFQLIAQDTINVDDIKIHTFVQRKAEPKEGLQHFYRNYISKFNSNQFSSPTGTLDVRLEFIVEKDGTFSDIHVLNEGVQGLNEESIRVLKTMPAWKPAIHNGKIVRSTIYIAN